MTMIAPYPDGAVDTHHGAKHLIAVWNDSAEVATQAAGFLLPGLQTGDIAVVMATRSHCGLIRGSLMETGLDLQAAVGDGRYIEMDADEVAEALTGNGGSESAGLQQVVESLLRGQREGRRLRIVGEVAPRLWASGRSAEAAALEQLCQDVSEWSDATVLCLYPTAALLDDPDTGGLIELCFQHTGVVGADGAVEAMSESRSVATGRRTTHLDVVRRVALAANAGEDPDEAFATALEALADYDSWPVALLWRRVDERWEIDKVHVAAEHLRMVADALSARIEHGSRGVLAAMLHAGAPTAVWRLPAGGAGEEVAAAAGLGASAAFVVEVAGEPVAAFQGFRRSDVGRDRELLAAMETISLQLSRMLERFQTDRRLRRREAQLEEAQQLARVGSWHRDAASGQVEWSSQMYRNLGLEPGSCPPDDQLFLSMVHPEDRAGLTVAMAGYYSSGERQQYEIRMVLPDGRIAWMRLRGSATHDGSGRPVQFHGTMQDVTEERHLRAEIERRATHDDITGLPNRIVLGDRIASTVVERRSGAVVVLDIAGLQGINDRIGRSGGDAILRQVAARMVQALPDSAVVCRVASDEYGILLPDVDPASAQRWLLPLRRLTLSVGGTDLTVSLNAGIADLRPDGDADRLVREADTARRVAKAQGTTGIRIYHPDMDDRPAESAALQIDLQQAVAHGAFELVYQPIVTLAAGDLTEVEALLRWNRPGHGPVSPIEFIPLAEQLGLISEISLWVITQACRQLCEWDQDETAPNDLRIAVNLSAHDLEDPTLPSRVADILAANQLDASRLVIEITETALGADSPLAAATLNELRNLGVRLAIDDFGTGYSSLSRLRDLPFTQLKIDRSFLDGIDHADDTHPIIQAMVAMARDLDMQVVIEGVETPEQRTAMLRHGCHLAQGYLFSPPVHPSDIPALAVVDGCRDSLTDGGWQGLPDSTGLVR